MITRELEPSQERRGSIFGRLRGVLISSSRRPKAVMGTSWDVGILGISYRYLMPDVQSKKKLDLGMLSYMPFIN